MSNQTTKLIPVFVIMLVMGTLGAETYCSCDIDLESYLPLLTALGLGGIPLSIIKKSIEAKKTIDLEKFKKKIK
jgi:hypothetical protein